ncbi:hypothetical protein DWB61_07585 [Ancylomarina euxinus]|uniref:Uncharacterized protein n=1 Tax=Ancylomarina euxinus TaxID=2283627 RepID=A0A425Y251_9BACT|nr:hypothetical protein [Ancylomarina euxinus]MCZ4694854.1 hypothetical protein [Ancylomarina euxinus]MUP14720.1 hypothetical protein [Ancylomarina euxinus]RRG22070.1 hypothetical protein DWB61_07585 [Ancylomarina euxinus]
METNKPKVIQNYEKLSKDIQEQIKLYYLEGFSEHLIEFTNPKGELVTALPFETEDKMYMVRMTVRRALEIVDQDSDFDDDGVLLSSRRERYEEKYAEVDEFDEDED